MKIERQIVSICSTNCYILYREGEQQGILVDPGDQAEDICGALERLHVTPVCILLTHGHFDHIGAVEQLRIQFKIPVYAGAKEEETLKDPARNLSGVYGDKPICCIADHYVQEGETIEADGFAFRVIETPGHTPGGICLYEEKEKILFAGDTIFEGSYGRVDFPGGNVRELIHSVAKKLLYLPEDVVVYPGHGEPTTIGREQQQNPIARYR